MTLKKPVTKLSHETRGFARALPLSFRPRSGILIVQPLANFSAEASFCYSRFTIVSVYSGFEYPTDKNNLSMQCFPIKKLYCLVFSYSSPLSKDVSLATEYLLTY